MSNITIDYNLYDRQIRTIGIEAVKLIASSEVTIIGIDGGMGTEIIKNLALFGVKTINIFSDLDKFLTYPDDIQNGYYYDVIGKDRATSLKEAIQDLNNYVTVNKVTEVHPDSILILVNQKPEFIKKFPNKMVVVFSKGVAGSIFVNAGPEHVVTDPTGENIEPLEIGTINASGLVECAPNSVHEYQTNDYITFTNLEGTNLDYFKSEYQIEIINKKSFQLKNFNHTDFIFKNGTAVHIKKPVTVNHKTFEDILKEPSYNFSFEDSDMIFKSFLDYFESGKQESPLAKTFDSELIPVISVIGSIAASEVIKLITHKTMPINQIWCWTDKALIPDIEPINKGIYPLGKLYGSQFENDLEESSWLIVGSGAIGCELLKNMAMMGVKTIYITDPDAIEHSNLNRQFLFRKEHIGKYKSHTAAEQILKIKSANRTYIHPFTDKVCPQNQTFSNFIMRQVTGVLNALDNTEARRYMDEQCFRNQKPLFESGTTGTKGNTQPVIPYLTQTYGDTQDPPEKEVPVCTLKTFPNSINHTIAWAKDSFFELFDRSFVSVGKWIKDENAVVESNVKEDVYRVLVKNKVKTFEDCVNVAFNMFWDNYYFAIQKLIVAYPADMKTEGDKLFWSNGKRMPTPIELDLNNEIHLNYIEAYSKLLAKCYGLCLGTTTEQIKKIASNFNYTSVNEVKEENIVLPTNEDYKDLKFYPQEFEKDDDTNWHVAWITAASNIRAMNYGIPPVSSLITKGIAGKIIPAIATTTSVVSGLIVLELIKYMLGKRKLEDYRSTFVNLADTTLVYSDPLASKTIEIAGNKFSNWERFDYKGDIKLIDFKKHYDEKFKTEISTIIYGCATLYGFMMEPENENKMLSELIKELDPHVDLKNGSALLLLMTDDDTELPDINFSL